MQCAKWTYGFKIQPTAILLHAGKGEAEPWSEGVPAAEVQELERGTTLPGGS